MPLSPRPPALSFTCVLDRHSDSPTHLTPLPEPGTWAPHTSHTQKLGARSLQTHVHSTRSYSHLRTREHTFSHGDPCAWDRLTRTFSLAPTFHGRTGTLTVSSWRDPGSPADHTTRAGSDTHLSLSTHSCVASPNPTTHTHTHTHTHTFPLTHTLGPPKTGHSLWPQTLCGQAADQAS